MTKRSYLTLTEKLFFGREKQMNKKELESLTNKTTNKSYRPLIKASRLESSLYLKIRTKGQVFPKREKKLTIGPSSRPFAPSNCDPGLFIARTGTPVNITGCIRIQRRKIRRKMQPPQIERNILL